jgi:hypothetical protein
VATQDGEKAVTASDVAVASSGNQLPKPLATYGKVLLRRPDMIGKIVKVWGNMGQVDPSNPPQWFFLNDQSGVQIKCRLAPGIMVNSDWSLISVTGVVSSEQISGATQPIALIRQSGDIRPLVGN